MCEYRTKLVMICDCSQMLRIGRLLQRNMIDAVISALKNGKQSKLVIEMMLKWFCICKGRYFACCNFLLKFFWMIAFSFSIRLNFFGHCGLFLLSLLISSLLSTILILLFVLDFSVYVFFWPFLPLPLHYSFPLHPTVMWLNYRNDGLDDSSCWMHS